MATTVTTHEPEGALPLLATTRPDPGHLWICHHPYHWQGPPAAWLDLASGHIVWPQCSPTLLGEGQRRSMTGDGRLDDALYVPPPAASETSQVEVLLELSRDSGVAAIVQRLAFAVGGEETGLDPSSFSTGDEIVVVDPLSAILRGVDEWWGDVEPGEWLAWPLLPDVGAGVAPTSRALEHLVAVGAAGLHPMALHLSAQDRRQLADHFVEQGSHDAHDAIFHRQWPNERRLSREAARHGLSAFFERPDWPGAIRRRRVNRALSGVLISVGELLSRLSQREGEAQEFFRAGRLADSSRLDLEGLLRENNLDVVSWLPETVRRVAVEWLSAGRSSRFEALWKEYTAGATCETSGANGR